MRGKVRKRKRRSKAADESMLTKERVFFLLFKKERPNSLLTSLSWNQ